MKELFEKKYLATLICLNKELFSDAASARAELSNIQEGKLVQFPESDPEEMNIVVLDTSIVIFKHHELKLKESGLTIPVKLSKFSQEGLPLGVWRFRYRISDEPFFEITKE